MENLNERFKNLHSFDDYISEKYSLNKMIGGLTNIFKSTETKKNDIILELTNILTDYKKQLLKKTHKVDKSNLKDKIELLKVDLDADVINKLDLDIFIKGIYDVTIKDINRNKKIEKYFDNYLKHLPKKVNKLFKGDGSLIGDLFGKEQVYDEYGDLDSDELIQLKKERIKKVPYDEFMNMKEQLQVELLKMQEWLKDTNNKIVVIFEGRDGAGKGSAIKIITEYLDPKFYKIATFGVPSDRDKKHWFERYEKELPKPGNITFYDRSWYNRAVNDPVMGYCTEEEYRKFMADVIPFENKLVDDGYILIKFWFSIEKDTQELRFKMRKASKLKYWKYSPNDDKSLPKYDLFTKYKEQMFDKTSTEKNPWVVVDSNEKRKGQLNCIEYILNKVPYKNKNLELIDYESEFIHVI